jgi:protein O-GlcNAc transferase
VQAPLEQILEEATALHKGGHIDAAERLYMRLLEQSPRHFDVLNRLAIIALQRGDLATALERVEVALSVRPDSMAGLANKGSILLSLKRPEEALAAYARALGLDPDDADAHFNYGNALKDLERYSEALSSYDKAIELKAGDPDAHCNRGLVLLKLKRPEEALSSFDRAIDLNPGYADAYSNRGSALLQLYRTDESLESLEKAIELNPRCAEAFLNRGLLLAHLEQQGPALDSFDRAILLKPDYPEAYFNRGNALKRLNRPDEALASFDNVLRQKPNHRFAFSSTAAAACACCHWERTKEIADSIDLAVAQGRRLMSPFTLLAFPSGGATQLRNAQNFLRHAFADPHLPLWQGNPYQHDKIRVAYVSADFRVHAVAQLAVELFELHDRNRFEIIALSVGPNDQSAMRQRLIGAFDQFHDVRDKSDSEAAHLVRDMEIDIAVDLNGFTDGSRLDIFARRPAPIQATYLGYPGTTGADFIDYVIADPVIAPFSQQEFYTEKIVHLPRCYQPNDRKRRIALIAPSRSVAGLPQRGFVFCCFNNTYKLTAEMFDVWMRLLKAVDGSVFWLLNDNATMKRNLEAEAEARGVAANRLVFAERLPIDQHLARHMLADLFVDTLPYNAHTTASDALWAGLPLVTCLGETFQGRVAASILHAIGLPELIASSLDEYEQLALRLARNPGELRAIKAKLQANRLTYPLFDTDRFARGIEAAYIRMWERNQAGLSPESFSVEEPPPGR